MAASGYDDKGNNNRDGRAYNAPNAYAGLSLRELCTSNEDRYTKLLEIRERVRATTEQSLGLLPGTLLIDFTTGEFYRLMQGVSCFIKNNIILLISNMQHTTFSASSPHCSIPKDCRWSPPTPCR